MIQKTFKNGFYKERNVIIRINTDYIQFFFEAQYYRHLQWLESVDEDELSDEEKEPDEFYGFEKERWFNPKENFPSHMIEKIWFTKEMLEFINTNVK